MNHPPLRLLPFPDTGPDADVLAGPAHRVVVNRSDIGSLAALQLEPEFDAVALDRPADVGRAERALIGPRQCVAILGEDKRRSAAANVKLDRKPPGARDVLRLDRGAPDQDRQHADHGESCRIGHASFF